METPRRHKNPSSSALGLLVLGAGLVLVSIAAIFAIPKKQPGTADQSVKVVPASVNFVAPDVKLTDLNGNAVALSDFRGKVILYNAWATWCPPCKEEMPTLQAYYDVYKDAGFVVVAIEDGEPTADVVSFVKDYGLTFPVWPDPTWKATTTFKINNLPTSYVIDRKGNARYVWTGAISREMLDQYITPLINGN
jgi:cytochrome c biogenesis protein CcmG, thiol:disulfide interchange protein DsbE